MDAYVPSLVPEEEAPRLIVDNEKQIVEKVTHVLIGENSDGGSPSEDTESDFLDLSDDTLECEFQKLSVAEKIKYNQFYLFHYQQQQQEKLSGMMYHIVWCQIRSEMIPIV